jgi:hypothetical protein
MRAGMSKGSTISQYGCSKFGALATETSKKKKKKNLMLAYQRVGETCYIYSTVNVETGFLSET